VPKRAGGARAGGVRRFRPKDLYTPHSGTPPGYRWITIHERPDHPLEYRHILVATHDGSIRHVPGRSRQARYLHRLLFGRSVALVAPRSATREDLVLGRFDRQTAAMEIRRLRREQARERRDVLRAADREWEDLHGHVESLAAAVRRAGGLRTTTDYGREDWRQIPLIARRRRGYTPSELLDDLRHMGWFFASGDELIAALRDRRSADYSRAAWRAAALDEWRQHDPTDDLIRELREVIRTAPRLRRREGR
jgi:hypothetical protein